MINKTGAKKLSSRNILGSKSKVSGTLNLSENLLEKDNYMDSVVCKAATTTNIDLDGSVMTIDDVVLATNDLVLVKDQTDKTLNGVYYAAATGFLRYDSIRTPTTVSIELGTVNKELLYYQITANYILGRSEIIYLKVDSATLPAGTEGQTLRYNASNQLEATSRIKVIESTVLDDEFTEIVMHNDNPILENEDQNLSRIRSLYVKNNNGNNVSLRARRSNEIYDYDATIEASANDYGSSVEIDSGTYYDDGNTIAQTSNNIVLETYSQIKHIKNVDSVEISSTLKLDNDNNGKSVAMLNADILQLDNNIDNTNKYLRIKNADGEVEFVDIDLLPTGTANQILRHNGTDWVVANYTTLTDTATSSKLAIVNGTSPTLRFLETEVSDTRTSLLLQADNASPAGYPRVQTYAENTGFDLTSRAFFTASADATKYVQIGSEPTRQYLLLYGFGGTPRGSQVYLESKSSPTSTDENICVQSATAKNFIVTNNGKIYTKANPQIDTTEATTGSILVCTDNDGNSQWQKRNGLLVQSANQEILTTVPIAITDFQFTAKANKKYLVKYRIYILNTQDDWSPNFQIKIGDGTGAETAFGSLLARSLDNSSYYLYKDLTGTPPKYNSLFDWSLGQDVSLFTNDYMHLDLEAVIEMGSTNKTVDLYITLPSTPTVPPNFTVRANSYMKYEMFD